MRTSRRTFLSVSAGLAALPTISQAQARDTFARDFASPPDSAKPRVWWHWMNGNVTREGIAQDLAWMKRVGIGGMHNFDAALATPQVVEDRLVYMSPGWKEAFRYAAQRAEALDLELAIAASPGWSETGGPWVPPEDGMKKVVWSETTLQGGERFDGVLPVPPSSAGPFQTLGELNESALSPDATFAAPAHYTDTLVLAYPVRPAQALPQPQAATKNGEAFNAALLLGADMNNGVTPPVTQRGAPGVVQLDYARAQTVRAATVFISNQSIFSVTGVPRVSLEASGDGVSWRKIADVALTNVPTTLSFAPVTARRFRLAFTLADATSSSFFTMAPGVDLNALLASFGGGEAPVQQLVQFELSATPRINQFERKAGFGIADDYFALDDATGPDIGGVSPDAVIDVTQHMNADGRLDWTPPPGSWKVIRFGYSLTGKVNHPATVEATGLEVDKFDAAAVERYMNTYLDMYRDVTGDNLMGARGLRALMVDSIEVGASNWTPRMREHFQRLRGYDATPWLPTLTGEIVGSRMQSDAFLYDFRRTLAELMASEHYGTVAKVAHERGLIVYGEALEGTRATLGDDLDMRAYADIPMSALWTYGGRAPSPHYVADGRGAASIAHLTGRNVVACESLTSIGQPHNHAPKDLQPMIDAIFANGVNRPVIHTSVHQPLEQGPGFSLQVFGQYFTRLETWAEMAKPWVDYMSRNSYMLQQGRNVADVAYFYGEDAPIGLQAAAGYPEDVPKRHAYDFISANALLNLLSIENGDVVSNGGARYKAIYLNAETAHMTLPVLSKLAAFVEAGGTIVGDAPRISPSLKDDAQAFSALGQRLWGGEPVTQVGRGRVIAGRDIEAALAHIGVTVDFSHDGDAELQFVHRQFDGGDFYYVRNSEPNAVSTQARFRVSGKAAELWHADTGESELVSYRADGAHTIVPLELRAHESVFVVFRTPTVAPSATIARPDYRRVAEIEGGWDVAFQEDRGAPQRTTLSSLASLSEHADPGIKYFSGISTYTKTFEAPDLRRDASVLLDLGAVGDVAEVRVNGRLAGTVWKSPYRLDISRYLRRGRNRLEVRVANLWVNRLIGDQQPGAERIAFTTVPTFTAGAPLRPAGLMGPVSLWTRS